MVFAELKSVYIRRLNHPYSLLLQFHKAEISRTISYHLSRLFVQIDLSSKPIINLQSCCHPIPCSPLLPSLVGPVLLPSVVDQPAQLRFDLQPPSKSSMHTTSRTPETLLQLLKAFLGAPLTQQARASLPCLLLTPCRSLSFLKNNSLANGAPAVPVALTGTQTYDFAVASRQVFSHLTGEFIDFPSNGTTLINTNIVR